MRRGKRTVDHLREHLLASIPDGPIGDKVESLEELRRTEWSDEFERYMRNRLLMGRFRYGRMGDPQKGGYDNIGAARRHIDLYEQTGNLEHLVDAANMCFVEFVHSKHPTRHFSANDDGEHARRTDD